ncbi:hypothetical protein [Actinoplanes utahensis]|uniref:Uncharacterized protein n=1 Tax=Actinoplanes utahensis TaxID=1869 RepID=A0A0A6XA00_ACTUT|nr:hypothetical protein [Actinoplanes utahensis]KHD76927.1 hypothetical protein MB27_14050 [Actinoplanes utahensis]GIF27313.1 hypothetical protein Aut01nite_02990 [Actinoplanes utahensis]
MAVISQAYPLWCAARDGRDVRVGRVFGWMSDRPLPEAAAAEKVADATAATGADARFSPLVTWDPPRGGAAPGGLVRCGRDEEGRFLPVHFGATRDEALAGAVTSAPAPPAGS